MISRICTLWSGRLTIAAALWALGSVLAESSTIDEARQLGARGNAQATAAAHASPAAVPGYGGVTSQGSYDPDAVLDRDARAAAGGSETGAIVEAHVRARGNVGTTTSILDREREAEREASVAAGRPFCGQGECAHVARTVAGTEDQMADASSWMQDARNASDDMEGHDGRGPVAFFRGNAQKCKDEALGFSNCCSDRGWGQDAGLARCSAEEQALGLARQTGRTHYVGHYSTGTLIETRHKSYCTFASILSRLVQEQGRAQLHMGWGSAEDPDCRPLSPEEMASLDLRRMDLSEFHNSARTAAEASMRSKPSGEALQAGIASGISSERDRVAAPR